VSRQKQDFGHHTVHLAPLEWHEIGVGKKTEKPIKPRKPKKNS
jgi:hypothetical protein